MAKLIKRGRVAVLVAPGYGAGWSTWNKGHTACVFDPDIVKAVLAKDFTKAARLATDKWGDSFCTLGVTDLEVEWLPEGTQFQIDEYDGSESLSLKEKNTWITA